MITKITDESLLLWARHLHQYGGYSRQNKSDLEDLCPKVAIGYNLAIDLTRAAFTDGRFGLPCKRALRERRAASFSIC